MENPESRQAFTFDPSTYGPVFAPLLNVERLNPLGPGTPAQDKKAQLESLDLDQAFAPQPIRDRDMARACLAGLWLLHDFLDESHTISQEINSNTGSYWHGIMHRREPDFGNAAYWFRRVGEHPIFEPLVLEAAQLAVAASSDPASTFLVKQERWDPFAFIDLCEAVAKGKARCELLCQQVQLCEWQLLFDFSYRGASGA